MQKVKRVRRRTRLSSKHQITIPKALIAASGLRIGDIILVHEGGPGRLILEQEEDLLERFSGSLPDIYSTPQQPQQVESQQPHPVAHGSRARASRAKQTPRAQQTARAKQESRP